MSGAALENSALKDANAKARAGAGALAFTPDIAAAAFAALLARGAEAVAIVDSADERLPVLEASVIWCAFGNRERADVVGAACGELEKLVAEAGGGLHALRRVLSGRILDRDRRGRSFWSKVTSTPLNADGFLLVQRTRGADAAGEAAQAAESVANLERYETAARCGGDGPRCAARVWNRSPRWNSCNR